MNKELFAELEQALGEMVDHTAGKKIELRTTVRPIPPKKYTPHDIVKIREKVKYSQSVFALGLNVSKQTVQAWEQGKREPDGAALKLLSIAESNPEIVFGGK